MASKMLPPEDPPDLTMGFPARANLGCYCASRHWVPRAWKGWPRVLPEKNGRLVLASPGGLCTIPGSGGAHGKVAVGVRSRDWEPQSGGAAP